MAIRIREGAKIWTTSMCGRDQAQRCFRWVRSFEVGIIHREKLCNRLYVMVGSRVVDTCHPVHTEQGQVM